MFQRLKSLLGRSNRMKRVKVTHVLMTIPVEAAGDDWDIEIEDSLFRLMQSAASVMQRVSDACNETLADKLELRMVPAAQVSSAKDWILPVTLKTQDDSVPVSQHDPPINTAVSDREMRSSEPEQTLEEFRQRPDRTRAPPRPRANSWRHDR